MVRYSQIFKTVPQFVVIYTVKGFGFCRIEIPYPRFSSAHHRQAIYSYKFTDEVPCGVWQSSFPRESEP